MAIRSILGPRFGMTLNASRVALCLASAVFAFGLAARALSQKMTDLPTPPVARAEPKVLEAHGQRRTDNYFWLGDPENPDVIAHLQAENDYAEARLATLQPQINEIANELRGRFAPADVTVPYFENGYFYERRFSQGGQYPRITRRKGTLQAPEETVLDVPALASGHLHYSLGRWTVSDDGRRVAFTVDFTGDRVHHVFVRTIADGAVSDEGIDGVSSDL